MLVERIRASESSLQCIQHTTEYLLGVQCLRFCITLEGNLVDVNPLFSSFLLLQPYTTHRSTIFSSFAQQKHRNSRKQRSCIDVTGPLSSVSRLARFCTQPEVKLHVFVRLIQGEKISMREQHEDSIKQIKKKKSFIYTISELAVLHSYFLVRYRESSVLKPNTQLKVKGQNCNCWNLRTQNR